MEVIINVMSRETFIDQEPAKYFQGEDLPAKPKQVIHLFTHSNFLSSDLDHSQDRPFTNDSPIRKKRSFKVNQFHTNRESPYCDFKKGSKKIAVKEGHHLLSTTNPLEFNPSQQAPEEKSEIKRMSDRNRSNLSGATAQPVEKEVYRLSKKMHSGKYTDSSSMKLSLSYIS